MNKSVISILFLLLLLVVPSSTALADTSECDHAYKITHFDEEGTATIKCALCGNTYKDSFIKHINAFQGDEKYTDVFDVCPDGVINAKDYHILSTSVYDDNFTVIDISDMSDNLYTIKVLLVIFLFAIGIIIGTIFLKHFSFWKW